MNLKGSLSLKHFIKFQILYLFMIILFLMLNGCWQGYVRTGPAQGFYYVVQKGDTLYQIARDNHVTLSQLVELNNLDSPDALKEGMVMFIPGDGPIKLPDKKVMGTEKNERSPGSSISGQDQNKDKTKEGDLQQVKAAAKQTFEKKPNETQKNKTGSNFTSSKDKISSKQLEDSNKSVVETATRNQTSSVPKGLFIWPVKGKVISNYGRQPNGMFYNGIRIETDKESAVTASRSGNIVFSALLKDYGETIIIKHEGNYATVYTHLSKRLVRVDQRVRKGEKIAVVVPEGSGTAFIDFEIRYQNKAKDPLLFL